MLAQVLTVFGAALWGFLGIIHIIYTFSPASSNRAILRDESGIEVQCRLWSGLVAVRHDLSITGGRSSPLTP